MQESGLKKALTIVKFILMGWGWGEGGGVHEKPDTDNRKFTKVSGAIIITNEIEVHFHVNFHTNA